MANNGLGNADAVGKNGSEVPRPALKHTSEAHRSAIAKPDRIGAYEGKWRVNDAAGDRPRKRKRPATICGSFQSDPTTKRKRA